MQFGVGTDCRQGNRNMEGIVAECTLSTKLRREYLLGKVRTHFVTLRVEPIKSSGRAEGGVNVCHFNTYMKGGARSL